MARKNVAEKNPAANPPMQQPASTPPRLQVVVSDQAKAPGVRITSALEAFGVVGRELDSADREHFIVLHLDGKNQLLAKETIAIGSQSAAIVHPREVFKGAVLHGSAAIVCVHNHPSGDPTPSQEDREITSRLMQASEIMGIRVLDHIIIGSGNGAGYYSFAETGAMPAAQAEVKPGVSAGCPCKSVIFDATDSIDEVMDRLRFVGCMDWDQFRENDSAQNGHSIILRDIEGQLEKIREDLRGISAVDDAQ